MTLRTLGLAATLAIVACGPPPPPPPPPAPAPETPPTAVPTPQAPPTPPAPVAVKPGTQTVLCQRADDDSWDKMLVARDRIYFVTDVNRWTDGPMYVPAARVSSVSTQGGSITRHVDLEGLATLAADETHLYVAVNRDLSTMNGPRAKAITGRIFKMPLGGGAPQNLATGVDPHMIAVDGDTIWFDGSRMPKGGDKPPVASGVKGALLFAFDADSVYFGTKGGRVFRMPKGGGVTTLIAKGLPDEPNGLSVDATHVYVSAIAWGSPAAEQAGVVARVPKAGGDLEILAKDQPALRGSWLSDERVYFLSGRSGRPGSVFAVPKTGGAIATIAADPTLVHAAVDTGSVYFTSDGKFQAEPFKRLAPAFITRVTK